MNIHNTFRRFALGVAVIGLSISPLMALQASAVDAAAPGAAAAAAADAATAAPATPADPSAPGLPAATTTNGPTSGAEGQVPDSDVFGFDITMGTANLTEEQRMAAKNTCSEKVMTDAGRYSGTARTFCQQLN